MPELPEITLFRNYVRETSVGKKITKVEFPETSLLQSPASKFEEALVGEKFEKTERLGKYLGLSTTDKSWLIFHFGMTGKLEYYANQEPPKYAKMIISFDDDYKLSYSCRRKLGKIFLAETLVEFKAENELGEDALQLSENEFLKLLEDKTGSIKAVLMDQHVMAGLGNVYSDEMLYQAGIHPKSRTNHLSASEKKQLYKEMIAVLELAIEKEGVRDDFPEDYLIRHRKDGADCPKCEGEIKQIKVAGRSTYFCPSCQKEEK
ncbi:Fpg/Nei family DNA glycosylase [Salinimicrobium oceani]|uniref:Formamidopyrimidine-DNA glycosylase n=1 Tax=Salinimicrobium oceani TaxID=2722702 RepID=A0ABX1CTS4_9FLAO|nr:DNA-formamidopyrimidine glycosylase family protein [Salinimicrobium oceani]NJW51672.1 formamidopyrimidine-DNA glycosylase [Salinimicrobium oceani]